MLANDFEASLQPTRLTQLDSLDIFDLPFAMEVGDNENLLSDDLDVILDFLFIPLLTDTDEVKVDCSLVEESLLPDVMPLLTNLDLQETEIQQITERFGHSGLDLHEALKLLFDVKAHDRDLMLNRVLTFANDHIEQISALNDQSKQIVNGFIIDLVELFKHLKIRQVPPIPKHRWTQTNQSVEQLEVILQNKIHRDLTLISPLKSVACVDINRFQTSVIVHQILKAYDLYILNNSYILDQLHRNATMFSALISDLAHRRITDNSATPAILKYVLVRCPGRGNLTQLCPQKPLMSVHRPLLQSGSSGVVTSICRIGCKRSAGGAGIARDGSDTTLDVTPANSLAATFDLLDDTIE